MKVKHALKILFSFIIFKIRSGPLKGKKWIMTTGSKFILGTQELYKTEAFLKYFRKGDVLFDIGAHVGYFSAIGAVINDESAEIYAFEPRPMNIRFFKKHVKANNFKNITLFEVAVGETDEEVHFDVNHGSATGCVSSNGKFCVKQVSIDRMIRDKILPVPDFIKIDVEGGEIEVLKGLKNVITSARPRLIVATHNPECHKFVVDFLLQNKYSIDILKPDFKKGDTEIVALPVSQNN
jgi:FkbM family methyltransferase